MGSLGHCAVCGGENCTRGSVICCMACGLPREKAETNAIAIEEEKKEKQEAAVKRQKNKRRVEEPALA